VKPRHTNGESPSRTGLLTWPGTELVAKQTRVALRPRGGVHRRHEDFQAADIPLRNGTHLRQLTLNDFGTRLSRVESCH
jgi:hypothetical protein